MEINSYDEIIQMKYLLPGKIIIGVKDSSDNDVDGQIRTTFANVAHKRFRNLFAFGVESSYSFRDIDNPDSERDRLFRIIMSTRPKWDTLIGCLDPSLNYYYKTVYYLIHYLRDRRPKFIPKDELVNHLDDMGCKKRDISLNRIYRSIKE